MDENRFWQLIDSTLSAADDPDEREGLLWDQLLALPPQEVAEFAWIFDDVIDRAEDGNGYEAWQMYDGVGSDDGFRDFRCWLVSRGRAVYEATLATPTASAPMCRTRRVCTGRVSATWAWECTSNSPARNARIAPSDHRTTEAEPVNGLEVIMASKVNSTFLLAADVFSRFSSARHRCLIELFGGIRCHGGIRCQDPFSSSKRSSHLRSSAS